ncbi:MotA/TolQ/ExbB proton channel [Thermosinus carboxydivorans Nor1]|uniref:MotA/TolQ/ExbB proton channel n=1 Tax=Thermosinus carboxydivorans Nor1 TaxID=401526 RepID=A1HM51_9FIRM|nr:flagellar motor stator protein MotA [Thermosinus carboxydivorans]EAX48901.1 MotA/TolQ/ExbB proton channel [Thermosinus carboxydivorans Nor1]
MEKSTVLGMLVGVVAISVGMVLKGANLSILLNYAAIMIIFVGTLASLLNAFPLAQIKKLPVLFKLLFKEQQLMPRTELLKLFVEMAQTARREGLLALEGRLEEISDPFLRNGLMMVVDGMDTELIRDVLEAEIELMQERHSKGALMFTQAGTYAPTLGVLGAVVGLIAALGNLDDIEKLGHSIAAAFVATLFGIFSGYVMWHPFANKLKFLSKNEVELKRMMIEGILSLQAGESPNALEAKLVVFIPQSERASLKEKREEK